MPLLLQASSDVDSDFFWVDDTRPTASSRRTKTTSTKNTSSSPETEVDVEQTKLSFNFYLFKKTATFHKSKHVHVGTILSYEEELKKITYSLMNVIFWFTEFKFCHIFWSFSNLNSERDFVLHSTKYLYFKFFTNIDNWKALVKLIWVYSSMFIRKQILKLFHIQRS